MAFDPKAFLSKYGSDADAGQIIPDTGLPNGPADMVSITGGKPTPQSRY